MVHLLGRESAKTVHVFAKTSPSGALKFQWCVGRHTSLHWMRTWARLKHAWMASCQPMAIQHLSRMRCSRRPPNRFACVSVCLSVYTHSHAITLLDPASLILACRHDFQPYQPLHVAAISPSIELQLVLEHESHTQLKIVSIIQTQALSEDTVSTLSGL